ncbi:MAG: flagellar hook-length control protein FliK, partial [Panacagrimonas sp.]
VDALCAEVALVVPGTEPSASCALPAVAVPVEPSTPTPEDPAAGIVDEGPTRTLRVLLTPPGGTISAEHRSANAPDAPTRPTLPLLPAAAAGASAFTVVSDAMPDAAASSTVVALPVVDVAPASGAALPLNAATGHAQTTHAVAATIVDTLHPQASLQIAETVAWHVPAQGVAEVQIRLNPEELGPLEVQLKLDGDKVSVRFDLSDERVRDVVQTSLPSLSSLLAARGLQLDQAQVFAHARGQGSPQQDSRSPWSPAKNGDESGDELSMAAATRPLVRRGLLDDYA